MADLVGSTALNASLGQDRYAELRERLFADLRDVVARFGGREAGFTGDGLLAALPSSTDAAACASAMHAVVARASGRPGAVPVEIRVGIALGDVEDDEVTLHGLAVVEAFRLCDQAAPSQTLCSEMVARALADRGFAAARDLGTRTLKGLPGDRRVFEIPWEAERPPLPAGLAPTAKEGPFVGRAAELATLRGAAAAVRSGAMRLVALTGEPGIGKTRIAVELARELHAAGFGVLHGRSDPYGGGPLQVFVRAMRPLLDRLATDEAMAEQLGPWAGVLARLEEAATGIPRPEGPGQPADQQRLFSAVGELLRVATAESPLMLFLDDAHLAGSDAHELLCHLARHAEPGGLLVVVTLVTGGDVDDGPVRSLLGRLRREASVERIDVEGLDSDDIAGVVSEGGLHPGRVRPELVERVRGRTNGNALYVCELVRRHLESELLDGAEATVDDLPESVRELVAARIGALDEPARAVLHSAALIGREFGLELLADLDDRTVDELDEVLDGPLRAGVIEEVPGRPDRYQFALPLISEVLAAGLAQGRRARLHRRIAEAIEATGREDHATMAQLAYHWSEAGPVDGAERGVEYALVAADNAGAAGAYGEAAEHYRRALRLLDALDLRGASQAAGPGTDARYRAERGLADSLTGLGDASSARPHYLSAAAEARRLADATLLGRVALSLDAGFNPFGALSPDPERAELIDEALASPDLPAPLRVRLLVTRAVVSPADDKEAGALAERAVEEAESLGDHALLGWVLSRRHQLDTDPSSAIARRANAERIVEIAGTEDSRELELVGWGWLAVSGMELGDTDLLEEAAGRREELAESLGDPVHRWTATMHGALRTAFEGRLDDAEAEMFRAVSRGIRVVGEDAPRFCGSQLAMLRRVQGRLDEVVEMQLGFARSNPQYAAASAMSVFWLTELGRLDEARAVLAGLPPIGALPRDFDLLHGVSCLALACPRLGEQALAREAIELLAPLEGYTCSAGDAVLWHTVSHAVAVAKRRLGGDDAGEWYDRAAEEYRRLGALPWLALLEREWAAPLSEE